MGKGHTAPAATLLVEWVPLFACVPEFPVSLETRNFRAVLRIFKMQIQQMKDYVGGEGWMSQSVSMGLNMLRYQLPQV